MPPMPQHAPDTATCRRIGMPALRVAIQRKFLRDNELRYDISQILTAGGARQIGLQRYDGDH